MIPLAAKSVQAERLQGSVALITGASRGVGQAVAKRFAGEGAHCILVARTVGGLEETDDIIQSAGGNATLVPLDLCEHAKIHELAATIAQRWGRLDILVGNAAMLGALTPLSHANPEMWERVFAVNVTANFHLLRACDPLLRASQAGRAIFVTSGITRMNTAYWGAYAASKSALESLVKTYAAETVKTNIRVNLIDPGIVRTKMRAEAFPGENPAMLPLPGDIADTFIELALPACSLHGQVFHI